MFVKEKKTGHLIRVTQADKLESPLEAEVTGRIQAGEEEQDEARFAKSDLAFPSGESLPKCWTDANYQLHR
ncbi:hypothetical protein Mal15_43060 [Stieleria maiorica]|uniref:Acetyltransferase n=1 Tax=Stieleria maiorica TaxID=2795974 RepID=A0A5B9MKZ3_9BACT|nr:acetyltransferase [Stieleria maiorica]QEG00236.1 hypothetical protein Mal15_43060 [Stieleria maiorica]